MKADNACASKRPGTGHNLLFAPPIGLLRTAINQPTIFGIQTNLERINCDSRSEDADPSLAVDHAVPKAELVAAAAPAPTGSTDGFLPHHDGHNEEVGKQTYGSCCHQKHHENLF